MNNGSLCENCQNRYEVSLAGDNFNVRPVVVYCKMFIHRKKAFQYSRPQPGCHLPNSPWAVIMESLVSDIPAGDGNIEKLFYGVIK